jgi:hypothetical protein
MSEVTLKKVRVTKEIAAALDRIPNDEWNKQFDLIGTCKDFSGNGIRMKATFNQDAEALNQLSPLDFAKCLIIGYESEEELHKKKNCVTVNGKEYTVGDIVVIETTRTGRRVMVIDKLNYSFELIKEINEKVQISARVASIKGLATEEEIAKEIEKREEETSAQEESFAEHIRLLRASEKHLAIRAYAQKKIQENEEQDNE